MSLKQLIVDFLVNNLEIIKNILLSLASVAVFVGLVVLYMKIYFIVRKIKKINKKIEKKQANLDQDEIDNIGLLMSFDDNGSQQKHRRKLEQSIQNLRREKEYLLEEISIYKIFKK